ncbi:hypothetical protein Nepgr_017165 [Nepenthes gracilis]|uniref:Uncharacterized protein n=1 Tax=Nepenthes gracilis TaxID=150966 RepID=A0AAD3SR49_NEPGR|nr:hypothetical protein Nepgr_017165 [Nepenthes gracilis]
MTQICSGFDPGCIITRIGECSEVEVLVEDPRAIVQVIIGDTIIQLLLPGDLAAPVVATEPPLEVVGQVEPVAELSFELGESAAGALVEAIDIFVELTSETLAEVVDLFAESPLEALLPVFRMSHRWRPSAK